MAQLASDSFTRADENPIASPWSYGIGTMQLLSNAARAVGTADAIAWRTDVSPNQDQYAECKQTGGTDGGPAVRVTTGGNGYYLGGTSGANAVWKVVSAATWTQIGSALNFTYTTSDVIRIAATGGATTSLKVYKNGSLQGTVSDSSSPLTTGSIGFYSVGATLIDDWAGGNVDTVTLEQEGFRFRADDGSESAATWLANQDTSISRLISTNTRLRMLLNATGDVAAAQYQLEWRLSGGTWRKVR